MEGEGKDRSLAPGPASEHVHTSVVTPRRGFDGDVGGGEVLCCQPAADPVEEGEQLLGHMPGVHLVTHRDDGGCSTCGEVATLEVDQST